MWREVNKSFFFSFLHSFVSRLLGQFIHWVKLYTFIGVLWYYFASVFSLSLSLCLRCYWLLLFWLFSRLFLLGFIRSMNCQCYFQLLITVSVQYFTKNKWISCSWRSEFFVFFISRYGCCNATVSEGVFPYVIRNTQSHFLRFCHQMMMTALHRQAKPIHQLQRIQNNCHFKWQRNQQHTSSKKMNL